MFITVHSIIEPSTSRNDHRICPAVADAFRPPKGQKEHLAVNALLVA